MEPIEKYLNHLPDCSALGAWAGTQPPTCDCGMKAALQEYIDNKGKRIYIGAGGGGDQHYSVGGGGGCGSHDINSYQIYIPPVHLYDGENNTGGDSFYCGQNTCPKGIDQHSTDISKVTCRVCLDTYNYNNSAKWSKLSDDKWDGAERHCFWPKFLNIFKSK